MLLIAFSLSVSINDSVLVATNGLACTDIATHTEMCVRFPVTFRTCSLPASLQLRRTD